MLNKCGLYESEAASGGSVKVGDSSVQSTMPNREFWIPLVLIARVGLLGSKSQQWHISLLLMNSAACKGWIHRLSSRKFLVSLIIATEQGKIR